MKTKQLLLPEDLLQQVVETVKKEIPDVLPPQNNGSSAVIYALRDWLKERKNTEEDHRLTPQFNNAPQRSGEVKHAN